MRGQAASCPKLAVCLVLVALATACRREVSPEEVALEYVRALYAQDRASAYRLLSAQDQAWRTEAVFVAEGDAPTGNALALTRHLASFIEVASAETKLTGDRAKVTLTLRLPNANAPEVVLLVRDWDEAALKSLSQNDVQTIRKALDGLHETGKLPMLEGDETFVLIKEAAGWRVVVNWVEGTRVRFRTRVPDALPLRAIPEQQEVMIKPGDPVKMTIRLANRSGRDLSMRVGHVIEPKAAAASLVFVQCPLLLPVNLRPQETKEFSIRFMVAEDPAKPTRDFQVTYVFRGAK